MPVAMAGALLLVRLWRPQWVTVHMSKNVVSYRVSTFLPAAVPYDLTGLKLLWKLEEIDFVMTCMDLSLCLD